jgi:thiamine kinase-like enzyme
VVVDCKKKELRICAVDWEMAAAGPGIIDLAALVSGGWTKKQEAELILTYMNNISPKSFSILDRENFFEDVACGQFHVAMQWLGWSASWSPPEEHKQNWLQIALGIIERFRW